MHKRERSFFSLGALTLQAPGAPLIFNRGSIAVDSSPDGWLRVRFSLEQVPQERFSWALDPGRSRAWSPVAATARSGEPRDEWRVEARPAVEGEQNPHADSRGRASERMGATVLDVRLPGGAHAVGEKLSLRVARTRDGIRVDLPIDPAAAIYGLGEKTGGLDKRGRTWRFWNSDDPIHLPDTDPLYQSIPVAYVAGGDAVRTVFAESPAAQYLDAGESDPGVMRIEAYDDQLDLYLRTDARLPDAVAAYTDLTGRMPLPPAWALGFQQCRYSYYPDARVLEVARRMREERLPADVIYLDIHYMDGYRVFTWNPERFPNPAAMIEELHALGFRVVTIVDPGVKLDPDYDVCTAGTAKDLFLSRPDGTPYVGAVWPGKSLFPDFTKSDTRAWWAANHRALLGPGIDGIWNDMNEPSDFSGPGRAEGDDPWDRTIFTVPDDLVAGPDAAGRTTRFSHVHNAYGLGMSLATRDAFASQRPDERGFVLTRAGYAGVQRYAAVWTGDNHSWWEHLATMIPMQLNLGLSGVPFSGPDTGGFQGNASAELIVRWFAAACLLPFFRTHTAIHTLDHEPWVFGAEATDAIRGFIELRYRLLPYLESLAEEASRTGAPITRPLVWEFPDDPRVRDRADAFLLGPSILVAPVRERGVAERLVYLPAGGWVDAWTGERFAGPVSIVADAPLDRLPLYVRAGQIIPYEAARQHTGEPGDGVLRLLVAPDDAGNASGTFYADAGEGFAYRTGAFWRASVGLENERLTVTTVEGEGHGVSRFTRLAKTNAGDGFPTDDRGVEISPKATTI